MAMFRDMSKGQTTRQGSTFYKLVTFYKLDIINTGKFAVLLFSIITNISNKGQDTTFMVQFTLKTFEDGQVIWNRCCIHTLLYLLSGFPTNIQ